MFTTKKIMAKAFYDYTKIIYEQVGRKISKYDEYRLKNQIDRFIKNYSLWNEIKRKFKKWIS